MKAKVYVTLKDGIHDPQGKAIGQALSALGFSGIKQVRAGKYFEIEMAAPSSLAVPLADMSTPSAALSAQSAAPSIDKMCELLLANTVIEKYRYEVIENEIKKSEDIS